MLLYHDPAAVNPRRVRIFAAEKGIHLETIEVSIADRANLKPEFLAKNPLHLLPVLELEDGRILRESMAICHYLEELTPEPNLLGADPWERAQVVMWNRHAELELLIPFAQAFRHLHRFWVGRIPQVPALGEAMKELAVERMGWFDHELGGRDYVAGDRFTVADITALCAIDFGRLSKIRIDPEAQPHLKAWYDRVNARPSSKA
jgi:glutathione S-transferase